MAVKNVQPLPVEGDVWKTFECRKCRISFEANQSSYIYDDLGDGGFGDTEAYQCTCPKCGNRCLEK